MNINEFIEATHNFEFIENVKLMHMFGGQRFFSNGVAFCHFLNNKWYFRVKKANARYFLDRGFEQLVTYKNQAPVRLNYFAVPDDDISDKKKLEERLTRSLSDALEEQKLSNSNYRVRDLPNLKFPIERALSKIGIVSVDELRKLGSVKAFIELKKTNDQLSFEVLYRLSAALKGIHINVLSEEDKRRLRNNLESSS